MFSEELAKVRDEIETIGHEPVVDRRTVEGLLERAGSGSPLDTAEIVALLNALSDRENGDAVLAFSREYRRPHDNEVYLLPPLYFSSVCNNACVYCDFSSGNGVRLSIDDFRTEVQSLLDLGYRSIELVSGQDPDLFVAQEPFDLADQRFDVSGVARYFRTLKDQISANGGGMVTSNIPPVCVDGFSVLRDAGLDCFLAWLETFDPGRYSLMHVSSKPKGHQGFRLDSFDRARQAGVRHVAGAFLKGLYDWRKEEAALYLLDRHLKSRWGRGFSIIGTPRVKGRFAESSIARPYRMSDEEYELNIALDRVLFDGVPWLQTRESFAMNRRLIATYGGGVILTINCSTAPGGYAHPSSAAPQFPVHYKNVRKGVAALEEDGLTVRPAWDAEDLASLGREGEEQIGVDGKSVGLSASMD